jgi:hypothetical protein
MVPTEQGGRGLHGRSLNNETNIIRTEYNVQITYSMDETKLNSPVQDFL